MASPLCPACGTLRVVRNGLNGSGTQASLCRGCEGRFVERPIVAPTSKETQPLILRLWSERMSLRVIARVAGVSRSWLQQFVNRLYRDESKGAVRPAPDPREKKSSS